MSSALPSEVSAAALKGWRLHPLIDGGKAPRLPSWQTVASDQREQLEAWNREFPRANWGAITGPASGLFVIDLDGDTGRDWFKLHVDAGDELPESWAVHTPRGLHLYFACSAEFPVRTSVSKIAPNVDVRGAGGYVVIPPSRLSDGREYKVIDESCPVSPAPLWLRKELQLQTHPTLSVRRKPPRYGVLCEGQRNDGLTRHGGALRRKGYDQAGIEAALIQANSVRCDPPLHESEVSKIAASVARYPVGGPDPLETAWQAVVRGDSYPRRYDQFLALARNLQASRPDMDIALPLERVAEHMGVHYTSVQQYRKRAVATGLLAPGLEYIPHRRAGLYRFSEL
jgi:hypothetical protein